MNKKNLMGSAIVGALSAIFAFMGMVTCCAFPILAALLSWLGIGASQLRFFAGYQTEFTILALLTLLFGLYKAYFPKQKTNSCCPPADSSNEKESPKQTNRFKGFTKLLLWLSLALVLGTLLSKNSTATQEQNQLYNEVQDSVEQNPCCT